MPSKELDLEFEQFFSCGERITDAAELVIFARRAELQGEAHEALQLYQWSDDLLEDCGPDSGVNSLRGEVKEAMHRLATVRIELKKRTP